MCNPMALRLLDPGSLAGSRRTQTLRRRAMPRDNQYR